MKFRLLLCAGLLLAACTKETAPVRLFLIASSRFTSGNRTGLQPADTLATRLYVLADTASHRPLSNVRITVRYKPTYRPFVYPQIITSFVYRDLPAGDTITYLDSAFTVPHQPYQFLLTNVLGVRTTTGSEQWEYTAADVNGSTSTRSFTLTNRRYDSLKVFNDYTLRLNVPAQGVSARRFIQLMPGLALPAYTVLGAAAPSRAQVRQQRLTDLIQSADGLRLYSPDVIGQYASLAAARWPGGSGGNRRAIRFHLTTLNATSFDSQQDTTAIRQQFQAPVTSVLTNLTVNQVYAFRTYPLSGAGVFGLLRVASVPGGTTAGLQLQIRTAKQQL